MDSNYLALQHIAATLTTEYSVPITLDTTEEGAAYHESGGKKEIRLGVSKLWLNGLDYYVGLLLHEIGHLRFSPAIPFEKSIEHMVFNMIEDVRIEQLIGAEYEGADWYLGESRAPALERFSKLLTQSSGLPREETIIPYLIDRLMFKSVPSTSEEKHIRMNLVKKDLFMRVCMLATLILHNKSDYLTSTGNNRLDTMSYDLATLLRKAKYERDVTELTKQALTLLAPILYEEPKENQHLEVLTEGSGHAPTESEEEYNDELYITANDEATDAVELLKRKLIGVMRENLHQRFAGRKRKGLLDKKALIKTARHNYRVYKKREELKGKDYAVHVIVDTSGSMWGVGDRINRAFYSAALMVRAFRGLGFPTGMTWYGWEAQEVLHPRERYIPTDIQNIGTKRGHDIYRSGENETWKGLTVALDSLKKSAQGRTKLLILITDGGLYGNDLPKSRALLAQAQKEGVNCKIFYVEAGTARLLKNDTVNEVELRSSSELIPACVQLLKQMV